MTALPLADPRWRRLLHRGGSLERPSHHDTLDVAGALRHLLDHPDDEEAFRDLWPSLCSEGTTWPAGYAAMPHLVDLAAAQAPGDRAETLTVLGLIEVSEPGADVESDIRAAYEAAKPRVLLLAAEAVPHLRGNVEVRYVLATIAAYSGEPSLAEVLQDLDAISGECPACGEDVYPDELQRASGNA